MPFAVILVQVTIIICLCSCSSLLLLLPSIITVDEMIPLKAKSEHVTDSMLPRASFFTRRKAKFFKITYKSLHLWPLTVLSF